MTAGILWLLDDNSQTQSQFNYVAYDSIEASLLQIMGLL